MNKSLNIEGDVSKKSGELMTKIGKHLMTGQSY